MSIKNFSKREKTLVSVCLAFGGMALLYALIIEPSFVHWKMMNDEIEAKTSAVIKNTRLLAMYKILKKEYAGYKDLVEVSDNEEEVFAKALAEIENLSQQSSCYIANVKPRASKELGTYKEISFEVTAEGDISQLSRFMYEIETSNECLRIRHFTILSKTGPSGGLKGIFIINKIILI